MGADAAHPADARSHQPLLDRCGLVMPTAYTNLHLHEDDWEQRVADAVALARAWQQCGLKYLVANPEPIAWGSMDDKDDAQLAHQAGALRQLHERLADLGLTLAYHTHDAEMRHGAREVHHMMLATDDLPAADGRPQPGVRLCFDAHWFFRGAGDSNLAVFDILRLYGNHVATLHLRQSHVGVWSDTLDNGDIDYARLCRELHRLGFDGPAVLELAREQGTPDAVPLAEAHRLSVTRWREWE